MQKATSLVQTKLENALYEAIKYDAYIDTNISGGVWMGNVPSGFDSPVIVIIPEASTPTDGRAFDNGQCFMKYLYSITSVTDKVDGYVRNREVLSYVNDVLEDFAGDDDLDVMFCKLYDQRTPYTFTNVKGITLHELTYYYEIEVRLS